MLLSLVAPITFSTTRAQFHRQRRSRWALAQYIARHGAKHGSFTIRENGDTIVATIRAQLPESKMGDSGLAHIPSLAIKKTAQALDTAAKQTIRRELREAKKNKRN